MTAEPEVFGPIDFVLLEHPADRIDGSAARAVIDIPYDVVFDALDELDVDS